MGYDKQKAKESAMDIGLFAGSFAATAIVSYILYRILRRIIRNFSRKIFGNADILEVISELDTEAEQTPRSLSGCDSLLLPKILEDFPDYDVVYAKTCVREYLKARFQECQDFQIHNVVISRYLPSAAQKTIVFQAAVSWLEEGRRYQKRYELNHTFLLDQDALSIAANCPNCGGAMGYGMQECPYCGSRVANVLGNTWKLTELIEK